MREERPSSYNHHRHRPTVTATVTVTVITTSITITITITVTIAINGILPSHWREVSTLAHPPGPLHHPGRALRLGSPQVLLLGPLSNIYVLGSLHPQEGPLRVGLGGGRLPVERQEETAFRDRQVGSAAVILGRYTPVL